MVDTPFDAVIANEPQDASGFDAERAKGVGKDVIRLHDLGLHDEQPLAPLADLRPISRPG